MSPFTVITKEIQGSGPVACEASGSRRDLRVIRDSFTCLANLPSEIIRVCMH